MGNFPALFSQAESSRSRRSRPRRGFLGFPVASWRPALPAGPQLPPASLGGYRLRQLLVVGGAGAGCGGEGEHGKPEAQSWPVSFGLLIPSASAEMRTGDTRIQDG